MRCDNAVVTFLIQVLMRCELEFWVETRQRHNRKVPVHSVHARCLRLPKLRLIAAILDADIYRGATEHSSPKKQKRNKNKKTETRRGASKLGAL